MKAQWFAGFFSVALVATGCNSVVEDVVAGTTGGASAAVPPPQLALTDAAACARLHDGTVRCWGDTNLDLSHQDEHIPQPNPTVVAGLSPAAEVAAGVEWFCALVLDGTVECWGSNASGYLGRGFESAIETTPQPVANLSGAVTLGVSPRCAVRADGSVWCWGSYASGEYGSCLHNSTSSSATATEIPKIRGAKAVASSFTACALRDDGTLQCWGYNKDGGVGQGTVSECEAPGTTVPLTGVAQVASNNSVYALLEDGRVFAWGDNTSTPIGLGQGAPDAITSPTQILGLPGRAIDLAVGVLSTCAVLEDHTLWCWGYDGEGEYGGGPKTANTWIFVPKQVPGVTEIAKVALGSGFACAVRLDGDVICWGQNKYGQLGIGTLTPYEQPTVVKL